MCSCDFDPVRFSHRAHPKAAKQHRCYECAAVIPKGERYLRYSHGYDGTADSVSVCLTCETWGEALTEAQRRECGCSGWELGGMWSAIAEFYDEHLSEEAQAAKARERQRRKAWTIVEAVHG